MRIGKAWTTVDRLTTVLEYDLFDKIKREFFQVVAVSVLLYGYTTETLIKHLDKKVDRKFTRMLPAVLNKSWKQQTTKQQLNSD